ncbi:unnamed protein product, partial [Staurois parvus]
MWSPWTLHSLYLVSPDPAFTISGLPGPCIHYIWSPRTLHSLYLVSPDPAFTISGLPGPCIHYIWSPTVHRTWKCNYFSKQTIHTQNSEHEHNKASMLEEFNHLGNPQYTCPKI